MWKIHLYRSMNKTASYFVSLPGTRAYVNIPGDFWTRMFLARATHTQKRYQGQIQSQCTILFSTWFWKVLNAIECDISHFCPLSNVQYNYLCTTQSKCALLSKVVAPNEMIPKRQIWIRRKRINMTMWQFYPREHKGKVNKLKKIKKIGMQLVWWRTWGILQREGMKGTSMGKSFRERGGRGGGWGKLFRGREGNLGDQKRCQFTRFIWRSKYKVSWKYWGRRKVERICTWTPHNYFFLFIPYLIGTVRKSGCW